MSESAPTYDDLKALALKLDRPVKTLFVLSAHCDPFYCGPARQAAADWFATEIWPLLDPDDDGDVHIRRLHYLVASQPAELRPEKLDGTLYDNAHLDWRELCDASLAARELGLVDADRFVDRRAGDPTFIFIPDDDESEAEITVTGDDIERPVPESAPRYFPQTYEFPALPSLNVCGPEVVEPYAIEIWAEKSTMNDILLPLARRLGVTLIVGVGELSLTHCHLLVERVREHGRKTRILYVSDHDPAGDSMPVSIARKIEFLLRREGLDFDIRLDPLVLTAEQVARYDLPHIPIKDSDLRFEARHGEAGVELDAFEAIHPGELARIVEDAVDIYREPTRATRREIRSTVYEVERRALQIRDEIVEQHAAESLTQLHAEFERMQETIRPHQDALCALARDYEDRIAEHIEAINDQVAAFYDLAEPVIAEIADDLEDHMPDLDDIAWPEPYEADESDEQLYQSERGYLEQIGFYKAHQGKPVDQHRRKGGRPRKGTNGNGSNGGNGSAS